MFGRLAKLFNRESGFSFEKGVTPSDDSTWPHAWKMLHSKEYPRFPRIGLPPAELLDAQMQRTLEYRFSCREFSQEPLTLQEVSTLLFWTLGINPRTKQLNGSGDIVWDMTKRFYPSGGARYPTEAYIAVRNVRDIERGIYHYHVKQHALERLPASADIEELAEYIVYPWAKEAPLLVMLASAWDRNFMKYRDQGYRMALMEIGSVVELLYLNATAMRKGVSALSGFNNQELERLLDLNRSDEEGMIVLLGLGNKAMQNKDFFPKSEELTNFS